MEEGKRLELGDLISDERSGGVIRQKEESVRCLLSLLAKWTRGAIRWPALSCFGSICTRTCIKRENRGRTITKHKFWLTPVDMWVMLPEPVYPRIMSSCLGQDVK